MIHNDVYMRCEKFNDRIFPIVTNNNSVIDDVNVYHLITNKTSTFVKKQNEMISCINNDITNNNVIYINEFVVNTVNSEIAIFGHHLSYIFDILNYCKQNDISTNYFVLNYPSLYYKQIYDLIHEYFNINYTYFDLNKTYKIKSMLITKPTLAGFTYGTINNIVNELISKINIKYANEKFYKNICKVKTQSIYNGTQVGIFIFTKCFKKELLQKNYYIIDNNNSFDYNIYLINKASNVIVSCGSDLVTTSLLTLQKYDEIYLLMHKCHSCWYKNYKQNFVNSCIAKKVHLIYHMQTKINNINEIFNEHEHHEIYNF